MSVNRIKTVRHGTGKVRSAKGRSLLIIGLTAVLILVMVLSLLVGERSIPATDVWQIIQGRLGGPDSVIIMDGRLPRTLAGILAGAALGLSGALIQGLTRNPLADPGILGINAGAGFAVVLGITFYHAGTLPEYLLFAFAGTLLSAVLVYLIGTLGSPRINPVRLTLAGVAVGAVLLGVSTGISLLDPLVFDKIRFWQAGTLDIRALSPVLTVAPFVIIGCLLALGLGRGLNAITMGEDLALALGTRLRLIQALALLAITLLCGSATALAGPIAFIGLMIPHVARWLVGPDYNWILLLTLLLTPVLLLLADIIGRVIVPGELRVSIVTAFIGAPVLIALVRNKHQVGSL
ncbi:Fe(3+)-siderophore ABC transporter permease [Biostraticola tofi]|uniref:Iron complex transport system permease protein n=1 Tax=Biostraticola tofi TaxID=466109 RepID=A0A4V6P4A7_9GAMM|nr:Fe(3+)-siderophore ABC transporter permease [Biostraticola tofi]TCW00466.1 iron complex transport system permease protein [Biostraticola tofi]